MVHLFLVRDVIDLSMRNDLNIAILSIDQEKAFDCVAHNYLLNVLKAFGFGDTFISWIKLLYRGASVMLKLGGGLSYPVPVKRVVHFLGNLIALLIKLKNSLIYLEMLMG